MFYNKSKTETMKDAPKAKTQNRSSSRTATVNITEDSIGVNEPELDGNSFDNYSIDGKKIKPSIRRRDIILCNSRITYILTAHH